jgi:N utilization substance protein B
MTNQQAPQKTAPSKGSAKARRSAARLLAVQAVYQMHENEQGAAPVIREFLDHRAGMEVDGEKMVHPDKEHFSKLVQGVEEMREQLADMVAKNRNRQSGEKEPLLQSIFLCGTYELMMFQDIDFPIIISDYVHVAQAFYDESESKMVNAVLDSIRKTVR